MAPILRGLTRLIVPDKMAGLMASHRGTDRRRGPGDGPSRALLLGALLLAGLLPASQAAGLLHLLTTSHQICREHGELVHGGHASGVGVAPAATRTVAEVGLRVRSAPPEAPEDGDLHEHCDLGPASRDDAVVPAPGIGGVHRAASTDDGPPRPAMNPSIGLSTLRVAPKTSPPLGASIAPVLG